jgi:hypothetical protein
VTPTTLVIGARAGAREDAIAAAINPDTLTALILEGLPDGTTALDGISDLNKVHIARIAPGCPCCTGNLTMRVTLNRILRRPPKRIYISLANAAHLAETRNFLQHAPYDKLLVLTEDIEV